MDNTGRAPTEPGSHPSGHAADGVDGASRVEALEDALRSLASYVGAGGYNAPTVDPEAFEGKVRWGINHLINATVRRCADIVEEQSKRYGRSTYGSIKRAILDLEAEDAVDAWDMQDWRIGQMHAELEHLAVSVKGGELYCGLCRNLVGEDGTLHPPSCPLSYGYDHVRALRDSDGSPKGRDAEGGSTGTTTARAEGIAQ